MPIIFIMDFVINAYKGRGLALMSSLLAYEGRGLALMLSLLAYGGRGLALMSSLLPCLWRP